MTEITYEIQENKGKIFWAASEHFDELTEKVFYLGDMEAEKIEELTDYSSTAKILLSAVAGAIIQHLLDKKIEAKEIFDSGKFWIEN